MVETLQMLQILSARYNSRPVVKSGCTNPSSACLDGKLNAWQRIPPAWFERDESRPRRRFFRSGHNAGAVISAYYLCREIQVEEGVSAILAASIDERWVETELFAPFPDETPEPNLITHILRTVTDSIPITPVRAAGHDVILPTLALKAFRDLPEAVTASRVDGICRLVEAFKEAFKPRDFPRPENDDVPEFQDRTSFAEFILAEFVNCTERFEGRGQGWSGHLLTYGRALLDLRDLGYVDVAKKAEEGYRMYIRRLRLGPIDPETDYPHPEQSPIDVFPTQKAYWEQRRGDWDLGHAIKYPYGFYGLMELAQNADIKERSWSAAYRVL